MPILAHYAYNMLITAYIVGTACNVQNTAHYPHISLLCSLFWPLWPPCIPLPLLCLTYALSYALIKWSSFSFLWGSYMARVGTKILPYFIHYMPNISPYALYTLNIPHFLKIKVAFGSYGVLFCVFVHFFQIM